jgi:hypothetical protein
MIYRNKGHNLAVIQVKMAFPDVWDAVSTPYTEGSYFCKKSIPPYSPPPQTAFRTTPDSDHFRFRPMFRGDQIQSLRLYP